MPECLAGKPPLADYERAGEEPSERRTRSGPDREPAWYVLWTHSHCERLVYDQLAAKGFDLLLPEIEVWAMRSGIRYRSRVPMFPSYLFLHHAIDADSHIEVRKARGLVRILGERWDRLAVVPDTEIDAIEKLMRSHLSVLAHPYLRAGQRVRITRGPLADIEGILVRNNSDKGIVVLSVHLLHRSVAVEVDCTVVAAA
ncbi:hypothetical protein MELA_01217 [Candidatus Methylomirabilis lanthanidiphila]|uniref:NusG-like N-terminal domain-containing protein n=1 Tax=Candidatus Methylomirabilis lanthanidiphila TaxID=2211376 RepID=A0A564ZJN1_9BACT|nr:hypothetical protein [Candidatus Methylomirabilis lanthanidiphila]VUZ84842.1 hypothetical protein MELA_01217 [Candidatus Methylomirabilis lanthanidiphila]